jgi:hypothetical protein
MIIAVRAPQVKSESQTPQLAIISGWSQQRLFALAAQRGMPSRTQLFR